MKILLTGAGSLLGSHVTAALLRADYAVRALVRTPGRIAWSDCRPELIGGDIRDPEAVRRAVSGCGAVIHLAADTSPRYRPYSHYHSVNVEGTRLLLEAAQTEGVSRFLYVSTANTAGYGSREAPGTEADPMRFPFTRSGYAKSKQRAEQLVLAAGASAGLEVAIFNPCFLIGAWDTTPSSGRILLRAAQKRFVTVPPGGKSFLAAADAARAIVSGLRCARNGTRYLLAGENYSYAEFYRMMRQVTGARFRLIPLPRWSLLAAGVAGSLLRACGIANAFYLNNMRILCLTGYYAADRARQELDLPATPLPQAIAEALAWFRETGRLQNKTSFIRKPFKTILP